MTSPFFMEVEEGGGGGGVGWGVLESWSYSKKITKHFKNCFA